MITEDNTQLVGLIFKDVDDADDIDRFSLTVVVVVVVVDVDVDSVAIVKNLVNKFVYRFSWSQFFFLISEPLFSLREQKKKK